MYFAEVSLCEQPTSLSHQIRKCSNLVRQVCLDFMSDQRKTGDMKQFWVINLRKSVL